MNANKICSWNSMATKDIMRKDLTWHILMRRVTPFSSQLSTVPSWEFNWADKNKMGPENLTATKRNFWFHRLSILDQNPVKFPPSTLFPFIFDLSTFPEETFHTGDNRSGWESARHSNRPDATRVNFSFRGEVHSASHPA